MSLLLPMLGGFVGGAAVATVACGCFHPRNRIFGNVHWRGTPGGSKLAISFDDGPHPQATAAVLDLLERYGAKASFFLIGRNVEQWPQVAAEIHARGHLIGNHSFNHAHGGMLWGRTYWEEQIRRTGDSIEAVTGIRPRWFRPPMGFRKPPMLRAVRDAGMQTVTWSRRGLDGRAATTAAQILRRLAPAGAGEILTLHDGAEPGSNRSPQAMLEALPRLFEAFETHGLRSVRIDELPGLPELHAQGT